MLKRTLYGTAFMLALLVTGCGDANQKTSGLPQIDVRTDYPEKEICLQDVAEVSYIPLETTDEILLDEGTGVEVLSSKGIVCVSDNKVYIFHPDGKLGSILDKKGEGPGEYRYLFYTDVDWERKEIYVHDGSQKAVLVYSLDGIYKHQFKADVNIRQHDLMNDNQGHLILYRENPGGQKEGIIEPPYRPVIRLSLEDGKVDSLSHRSHYFTTMFLKVALGDGTPWTVYIPMPALTRLNNEVYVSEVASDTIYRLADGTIEPFITRTPSVREEDGKYLLYLQGITSRHYFLRLQAKKMDASSAIGNMIHVKDENTKKIMYDKATGDICIPLFKNQDYQALDCDELLFNGCDANTAYMKLDAFTLIEALEAGELSGELKSIAEGLKEDDNPVLMVVKFNE